MLTIKVADEPESVHSVQTLWKEYWKEIGLPSWFQGFEKELRTLPGKYAAPRGTLTIAYVDGVPAATVALRPLTKNACEVKRLYVRPRFRRRGVGRGLMEHIIRQAQTLGYETLCGDTLPTLTGAIRMYRGLGFRILDRPYSENPTPGAIYLELRL